MIEVLVSTGEVAREISSYFARGTACLQVMSEVRFVFHDLLTHTSAKWGAAR